MSVSTVQFFDGIVTARTAAGGLPPTLKYDWMVVHPTVAMKGVQTIPSGRPCDDLTEIIAAEVFSECRIQVGPEAENGKAKVRLYVRETIPFDPCKDPGGRPGGIIVAGSPAAPSAPASGGSAAPEPEWFAVTAANSGDSLHVGAIIGYTGYAADIPDGWALCDGTNGTPDWSDLFKT